MDVKKEAMLPQLKALKTNDISPLIRMAGLMAPRLLDAFLPKLDEKQRKAFDKVLPVGGQKKLYAQLVGTPTPPIVIEMAQPIKMRVVSENEVSRQEIKWIKLTVEDLQVITERRILKIFWRLKSQIGTLLSLFGMFAPFILLGPAELKDLKNKAKTHFKPMLDLLPHPKN
jgi:hypothetical protein